MGNFAHARPIQFSQQVSVPAGMPLFGFDPLSKGKPEDDPNTPYSDSYLRLAPFYSLSEDQSPPPISLEHPKFSPEAPPVYRGMKPGEIVGYPKIYPEIREQ